MSQTVSSDRVPVFSLGERIRKAREDLRLSQQELADRIDVHRKTVTNWEADRNEPRYGDLMLLSSVANVNLEWLAGDRYRPDPTQDAPGVTRQYRSSTLLSTPSPKVTRTTIAA